MPGGGLLADAVAVELVSRGLTVIDPASTSNMMVRLKPQRDRGQSTRGIIEAEELGSGRDLSGTRRRRGEWRPSKRKRSNDEHSKRRLVGCLGRTVGVVNRAVLLIESCERAFLKQRHKLHQNCRPECGLHHELARHFPPPDFVVISAPEIAATLGRSGAFLPVITPTRARKRLRAIRSKFWCAPWTHSTWKSKRQCMTPCSRC